MSSASAQLAPGWRVFGKNTDLQRNFDVAVIMPTVGRDSILDAVSSIYSQTDAGRIQLLIGVDIPRGDFSQLEALLDAAPEHVTPYLFYPGYSTSARHGGLHPAHDGGSLRTTLCYLANARYLAFLDDDNWWAPEHLSSMLAAIQGHDWAFALRWFIHPDSRQPVCIDDWESVGPGRGCFAQKFGGWVDPNCLMIDKVACEPVMRWWSIPLPGAGNEMAADRHIFHWLQQKSAPGETGQASVYYAMQPADGIHPQRLAQIGERYAAASQPMRPPTPRVTAITTCKGRLDHLKQTLPLLAAQPMLEIVVVDYGCPQGTAAWVRENHPDVKVVEVLDDPGFASGRARNFGAKAATTPWLLFIDADTIVQKGLDEWMQNSLLPGAIYLTTAYGTDLTGTVFCSSASFAQVGGYDEAIREWPGNDEDLYVRLSRNGSLVNRYPEGLFLSIPHSDEERFKYADDSNSQLSRDMRLMAHNWYCTMKYDLAALRDAEPTLDERTWLKSLANKAGDEAMCDGALSNASVYLDLGMRNELSRLAQWQVRRRLVYELVATNRGDTGDAD